MLVFLCPFGQPRHSNFEYAASTSSVQDSYIGQITPPFQKSAQLRIPPPPQPPPNRTPRLVLVLTQTGYSQLWKMNHQGTSHDRMLRTWPRIIILNNFLPKWYREGKWHDLQQGFIHFHPIYYLKGDRALGNSILRNSSSECQNQDQHSFIARTNTDFIHLNLLVAQRLKIFFIN